MAAVNCARAARAPLARRSRALEAHVFRVYGASARTMVAIAIKRRSRVPKPLANQSVGGRSAMTVGAAAAAVARCSTILLAVCRRRRQRGEQRDQEDADESKRQLLK